MARKRPCSVCRRWFEPNPRAVKHQKTCGADCSRELHRRRCAQWHRKNPNYDREERLRRKMVQQREAASETDPLRAMDWEAVQDAVGLETRIAIEEATRLSVAAARDAVPTKTRVEGLIPGRLPITTARDAVPAISKEQPRKSNRLPRQTPRDLVGRSGPGT